jgi:hypothetical protein
MSTFEYFTVLLSFVVSLGVANLLQALTQMMQAGSRVRISLAYGLWFASIFNLQIAFWLKAWTYSANYQMRTETTILPLVLAILAFITCGLATPRVPAEGVIDLRAFHAKQGPKYQGAYAAFMLVSIIQAIIMHDVAEAQSDQALLLDNIVAGLIAATCIAAACFPKQNWLQIGAPAVFLLSFLRYYGQLMEA